MTLFRILSDVCGVLHNVVDRAGESKVAMIRTVRYAHAHGHVEHQVIINWRGLAWPLAAMQTKLRELAFAPEWSD